MNEDAQKALSRMEYWDKQYVEQHEQKKDDGWANYEWFKRLRSYDRFSPSTFPMSCVNHEYYLQAAVQAWVHYELLQQAELHSSTCWQSVSADLHRLGYTN